MFEKFLPIAMKYIGIDHLPKMKFRAHIHDDMQPTFGKYENGEHVMYVALTNRHPNDILRTIAHELTHYRQDTEHQLNQDSGRTGSPIENEANAVAGIVMRHFNQKYPEYLSSKPITESVNIDVFKRGFNKTQDFEKYTLTAEPGRFLLHQTHGDPSEQFTVKAHIGKTQVGWVNFEIQDDHLEALDLYVDPKHRRKGLATAMYQFAKELGNDIRPSKKQTGMGREFWATKNPVGENFADGKNPGRKGLAKRSGVNTKASVSSLRKTAKHSTGEKQRMSHWLANMKAGRKRAAK
jgi:GNAT superfamily N-acetyltransferase